MAYTMSLRAKRSKEAHPRPDPVFFEVMGVIYAASYSEGQSVVRRAAYPYASVYLLGKYLEMHPKLRGRLRRVLDRGRETMRWNVTHLLTKILNYAKIESP